MRKLSILSYIFGGLMLSSCDGYLKEDPRDQLYPEDAYDIPQNVYLNTVASLYNYIGGYSDSQGLQGTYRGVYDLNTFTTDEAMLPTRGGDWYDGGFWQGLFLHKWGTNSDAIQATWEYLYKVIVLSNQSLEILGELRQKTDYNDLARYEAEVRALRALRYFKEIPALDPQLLDWLLLEDSMTKRFEQQGKTVSVTMIREGFVEQNEIPEELPLLPKESRYWLREILLCADGEPWLAGRTVVPVSTLSGPELALQKLGKTPLGRYLFTSSTLTRDFIEIGRDAGLWGRRSRLRLSGKPLLLTELFLPASPLY